MRVKSFEVDAPKTQAIKREMLDKTASDSTEVTYVSADSEKEDWLTRLVDAGFDPGRPALFLWGGVMMYLDREAAEATLRKIAGTAKGSVVAFDYFTTEPLESRALYWRYGRAMTRVGSSVSSPVGRFPPFGQDGPRSAIKLSSPDRKPCQLSLLPRNAPRQGIQHYYG